MRGHSIDSLLHGCRKVQCLLSMHYCSKEGAHTKVTLVLLNVQCSWYSSSIGQHKCTRQAKLLTSSMLWAVWPMMLCMFGSGFMVKCACSCTLPSSVGWPFSLHVSGTTLILSSPAAFHLLHASALSKTQHRCQTTSSQTV